MNKTKNFTQFSIDGLTIYFVVKVDGIRNRSKFKFYNESVRKATKEWKNSNKDKVAIYGHRRRFGYAPLNKWFEGSHYHHMHIDGDHAIGAYVPVDLHRSIHHAFNNLVSMEKINEMVFKWIAVQEIL